MAYSLKNKPNVDAPTLTYPYGNIKDDDGTGNGTPLNKLVHADFHQFFARLLALAGISANELPDNAYNGFEYIDALEEFVADRTWLTAGSFTNSWSTLTQFGYRKTKYDSSVELRGSVQRASAPNSGDGVFTLPAAFKPSATRIIPVGLLNGSATSYYAANIVIDTNGLISLYESGKANGNALSGSGAYNLYLDSVEFSL
jgi:hypothetical protein